MDRKSDDAQYDEYDDLGVQCPPHTTQRRLVTRIDLRVIPVLSVLYFFAFLDRTNIANYLLCALHSLRNSFQYHSEKIEAARMAFGMHVCLWPRHGLPGPGAEFQWTARYTLLSRSRRARHVPRLLLFDQYVV